MKKYALSATAILLVLIAFWSCKKETTTTNNPTIKTPITNYDKTSQGIYKGVFIGSSGTILIKIHDGDSLVTAYLNIDGIVDTLISSTTYISGQDITSMTFTSAQSTMVFSVNADGSNPNIISIDIDGHDSVTGAIVKVLTTQQVYCYEGTYSGDDIGTFNCVRFGDNVIGMGKSTNFPATGTRTGNAQIIDSSFTVGSVSTGAIFNGTFINRDSCVGTWNYPGTALDGSFTAIKTL